MSKSKTTYVYKLFRVKRNDGRVTTVSVDPALVIKACQVIGGLPSVSSLVREAAFNYDPEASGVKNCSRYVSTQLMNAIDKARAHA